MKTASSPLQAQILQAEAAERIADLLLEVALLIALNSYPNGCPWRPP